MAAFFADSISVSASDSFVLHEEQETSYKDDFVVNPSASTNTKNTLAVNKELESKQMKIASKPNSEETKYETDPWKGDDFGGVVDTNEDALESKVSASDNVSMVDSVTTILIPNESKELDFLLHLLLRRNLK